MPPAFIGNCFVIDTDRTVDLLPSTGSWVPTGQYAVEVYPGITGADAERKFLESSPEVMRSFIANDRASAGFRFQLLGEEATTVGGRPAYRAMGTDASGHVPAVFIGTSVLLKTRVVVASLILPLNAPDAGDPKKFESWKTYNEWVSAVAERP